MVSPDWTESVLWEKVLSFCTTTCSDEAGARRSRTNVAAIDETGLEIIGASS
jgi:hypothetical protein